MRLLIGAAMLCCLIMFPARADVVLDRTRLVYSGSEHEAGLRLRNEGAQPSLVQIWIDSGDAGQAPDESDAPFLVTPPVVRIEPQSSQRFRIRHTGAPLPEDRESVFWINVLEIPPMDSGKEPLNRLHVVIRSRIKLFFRPDGLAGRVDQAPDALKWRAVPAADGEGWELECENPTAYHISFSRLAWHAGDDNVSDLAPMDMLAPYSRARIPLASIEPSDLRGTIHYTVINDYGGRSEFSAPLTHER